MPGESMAKPQPIEFENMGPEEMRRTQKALAAMTRSEAIGYADRKMMARSFVLSQWSAARTAQRA